MAVKLLDSNYVITDNGHKTILDLYNYQVMSKPMPKIMSFTQGYSVTDISTLPIAIYLNDTNKLVKDTDYILEDLNITFIPLDGEEHRLNIGDNVFIHIIDAHGSVYDINKLIDIDSDLDKINISSDININAAQKLYFRSNYTITKVDDVDLLQVRFSDHLSSRMSDIICSGDGEIFQYDIKPVSNEPIIDKTRNVYQYLTNNHTIIETLWKDINSLVSFGVMMPNLTFSDIVTRFLDKSIFINNTAYTFTDNITGLAIPLFVNRNTNHSNFILIR